MNQTESESEYKAFWGLISSHTLLYLDTKQNGEQVLESENKPLIVYELDTLNKRIESSTTLTRWTRVKHRIWIMHYSIAIYRWALSYHIPVRASQANIEDSYPSTVETGIVSICIGEPYEKFQDKSESSNYLPIIQLGAPHLMPYVVVAFIISLTQNKGNYKKFIPSISKAIDCIFPNTDKSSSLHPVVKIAQSLFITYDFDSALEALKEVKELKDIFLSQHIDSFVKSANQLIATAYANVHSILRLSEFLSKFNLKREEINSVIEDFKVDDELDKIWVTHTPENIHHYIKEKVDDILKPKEKQQYHGDRTYGDRSYGDRSYGSYGYGDRSYGDRSYGEGKYYKKYDNQGSQKAQ